MTNYVFDMETSDPDDVFALALLATHPRSNLVAVTIHPGGHDQVGLVRHVLDRLGVKGVYVGAGTPKKSGPKVSAFHYDWLGKIPDSPPDGTAVSVIQDALWKFPDAQLVTGAALTNIANAARDCIKFFNHWTCQGGFAGDNVVPEPLRLPKFNGLLTCPTYNLNGDPTAAQGLLCNPLSVIHYRRLVPKNVCHGIFWPPEFNDKVPSGAHPGLDFIKEGMRYYFKKRPMGKALHDVVAAAAALTPSIGTWVAVDLYRAKTGEWGCNPFNETTAIMPQVPEPVQIMIALNMAGFEEVLAR